MKEQDVNRNFFSAWPQSVDHRCSTSMAVVKDQVVETFVAADSNPHPPPQGKSGESSQEMAAMSVPGLRTGAASLSPELPSILREPIHVSAVLEKASRVPGCTERAGDTTLGPAGEAQRGHPAQGEGATMLQGRAEQGPSGAAKGGVLPPQDSAVGGRGGGATLQIPKNQGNSHEEEAVSHSCQALRTHSHPETAPIKAE